MSDYDKQQWQEQQRVQDAALDKQRQREAKARERSARNAKRKLERLHATLKESGELTEWEGEFATSVTERIDEFGSAFADLQKGRPGDALSFAQKRVVAGLNKKVKDARKAAKAKAMGLDKGDLSEDGELEKPRYKPRRSFKSKNPKFTPRVRHIEDDFAEDHMSNEAQGRFDAARSMPRPLPITASVTDGPLPHNVQRFVPQKASKKSTGADVAKTPPEKVSLEKTAHTPPSDTTRPPVGRPFLRVVGR